MNAKVGDEIRITEFVDPYEDYTGRTGVVEYIDDMGQLHGTWGSLAIIPGTDKYEIIPV